MTETLMHWGVSQQYEADFLELGFQAAAANQLPRSFASHRDYIAHMLQSAAVETVGQNFTDEEVEEDPRGLMAAVQEVMDRVNRQLEGGEN